MTEILLQLDTSHLDDLSSLEQLSFSQPWTRRQLLALLEQGQGSPFRCYGITWEKKLAGYLSFYELGNEIEILNLATAPKFQRCGYASRLLATLFAQGKQREVESVILEVRTSNHAALALYRKFSFQEVGRRRKYYQDSGEDALIMRAPCNLQPGEKYAFS